jgi:hypothetical protein
MRTDTLSGAYATMLGRTAQPTFRSEASLPVRPRPLSAASPAEPPLTHAEALFIALRRSLASCRDTTQLKMLAAFEVAARSSAAPGRVRPGAHESAT